MASWHSKFIQRLLHMTWDREVAPDLQVSRLRAKHARMVQNFVRQPRDVEISRFKIGEINVEWIEPAGAQFHRVLLYLHGGGFVMGELAGFRNLVARIATAASARALLIDYRLAPEHPFPAALEDTLFAYRWLLLQGLDPSGIAIVGDGSGGGMAISACVALRDNHAPLPGAIVALSPWTDLALGGRTLIKNASKDALVSIELLAYCAQSYLRGALPTSPLASPNYANLAGLPPLLVHAGSNEVLRDDATRLGDKAHKAGIDMSVEVFEGMPHVFQLFEKIPEAEASVNRIGAFIKSRTVSVPLRIAAQ
jgi:epsilon-lactone hydrolase